MNENVIIKRLDKIHDVIEEQNVLRKDILNTHDACIYLNISESNLYQRTSKGEIPFYRPGGKRIYFEKADLDKWILQNKSICKDKKEDIPQDKIVEQQHIKT